MSVYLSVTTDAFAERMKEIEKGGRELAPIRRPVRGIQARPNTYAVIRARTASGKDIPLLNSSSSNVVDGIGRDAYNANFLIQNINESRMEKQQIIETFGEDYVYFFGEQPRFLNVSGMLLNTADFNWKEEFWTNYDQHLRGTRLVEQNARVYLYYENTVVEGYFMTAGTSQSVDSPHMLPFNFQFFVTNYAILGKIGSVFIQPSDDANYNPGLSLEKVNLTDRQAAQQLAARIGAGSGLTGFLAAAGNFVNDASFSIQSTLDSIKNFLYARRIAVPEGLDSQVVAPNVQWDASFREAPTNRPIHEMNDEFILRSPQGTAYDQNNIKRTEASQELETPEALDKAARARLAELGVDVEKPNELMLLLGRGAFAALQYTAPMALDRTGGKLGVVDQGISSVL